VIAAVRIAIAAVAASLAVGTAQAGCGGNSTGDAEHRAADRHGGGSAAEATAGKGTQASAGRATGHGDDGAAPSGNGAPVGNAGHGSGGAGADRDSAGASRDRGPETIRIAPDMMRDLRITTGKAQARAVGETVSALGELRVNEDAYAEVAAPVAARVARVLVRAGDAVKAGQALAELTSPELVQARAELEAARSRLDLARKAAERKRALAADRLVPEREVLEAEAALGEADAAHRVATAALRRFGAAPGGATAAATGDTLAIRAPIDGTVIERSVVQGQLADPARTLFRIGDLSTLWLHAHVFERDAVRVALGRTATATFAALPGASTEATIQWIGREVDASSRTIDIRLDVANRDGVLRPGMSATVSIPLGDPGQRAVATVPIAAVQRVAGSWAVFIPRGPGQFAVRPIGRGRDLSGAVEVLSGLVAGDEVVIDGAFLLKAEADKASGAAGHEE
jgi:cobalt-zinc-cadmium efflux system membrane fusion protein